MQYDTKEVIHQRSSDLNWREKQRWRNSGVATYFKHTHTTTRQGCRQNRFPKFGLFIFDFHSRKNGSICRTCTVTFGEIFLVGFLPFSEWDAFSRSLSLRSCAVIVQRPGEPSQNSISACVQGHGLPFFLHPPPPPSPFCCFCVWLFFFFILLYKPIKTTPARSSCLP